MIPRRSALRDRAVATSFRCAALRLYSAVAARGDSATRLRRALYDTPTTRTLRRCAALDTLAGFAATRRIAVLGDMRELGEDEDIWHRELGKYAAGRVDRLVCVGELARYYGAEAVEGGFPRSAVEYVGSPEEVARLLDGTLSEGDVVLFKGSRAVGLDRAVELLTTARIEGSR